VTGLRGLCCVSPLLSSLGPIGCGNPAQLLPERDTRVCAEQYKYARREPTATLEHLLTDSTCPIVRYTTGLSHSTSSVPTIAAVPGLSIMTRHSPADRAAKMELRRAAVAARKKRVEEAKNNSPIDARATAREAALTLASIGGGLGIEEDSNMDCAEASSPMAVTPNSKSKRPAAAGSPLESVAKVGRYAPAPAEAFVSSTASVAAAGVVAVSGSRDSDVTENVAVEIAPRPVVLSGPFQLVGPPAPGPPAGPSGDPSAADEDSPAAALALGLSAVYNGGPACGMNDVG